MKLRLDQIAEVVGAVGNFDPEVTALGYSIDSRTTAAGELFFAICGENFDGHDFVAEAFRKGAVAAVVASGRGARPQDGVMASNVALASTPAPLLEVRDPILALQTLAAAVRRLWNKPLIAVTGSAGKTTTKEMIGRLLGTRYRVLKSDGNLNNHFGLPLQLLRLEPEHELAVMELGMNHAGEIAALARLATPNLGVVTNVAPVHLGFFRSVAGIAAAKKELIEALPPDGTAVLNADDQYTSQFGAGFRGRTVTFGLGSGAAVYAQHLIERGFLGSKFDVLVGCDPQPVDLSLAGRHNVYNALAALAVALQFDIAPASAAAELADIRPVAKRGEIVQIAGVTVCNDCYNSNPRALDSMVDALAETPLSPGGRRIVVAGEMLELGPAAEALHRRCGRHMVEKDIDVVLGVRGLGRFIVEGARESRTSLAAEAVYLETPEMAGEWLARMARPGDLVLVKGSRGVRLERALEVWCGRAGQL